MGTPDVTNWRPLTPPDAAAIMDGYPGPWWISGGWAVEAFTGTPRPHGDLDVECLRDDLALLRRHLAARYELGSAHSGSLTPLPPDDRPDAQADDVLPPGTNQIWARPDAASPWECDLMLSRSSAETWVYKRDPSITMPMQQALWERAGVRYLCPELQLLHKAKAVRPKDQADSTPSSPCSTATVAPGCATPSRGSARTIRGSADWPELPQVGQLAG